jgi:hypothetical protein
MRKYSLYPLLLVLAVAAIFSSCASSIPQPTAEHKNYAQSRWQDKYVDLDLGRGMYIEKCSGCHSLIEPSKFAEEKWMEEIKEMKVKAKLSDDEEFAILTYVLTEASVPRTSRMN